MFAVDGQRQVPTREKAGTAIPAGQIRGTGFASYTAGGDGGEAGAGNGAGGWGKGMHGSDNKQKVSWTQWGLQALLVVAVVMALWK